MESRAESCEADQVAGAWTMRLPPFGRCNQHGSRRSVAVAADVRIEHSSLHVQSLGDAIDQILIGLVHQKYFDRGSGCPIPFQQLSDGARDFARGLHDYRSE